MPTYQKCPKEVVAMSLRVMQKFERHQPLIDCEVTIQIMFAYPKYDDNEKPVGNAIMHHGVPALGLAKINSLKDRVKGNCDADIILDYEWWEKQASEPEKEALLDHELTHLTVQKNKHGVVKTDDINRPKLRMRKHDFEFGWFTCVARDHHVHSQEQKQATVILNEAGQYYWPLLDKLTKGELMLDQGERAAVAVRGGREGK